MEAEIVIVGAGPSGMAAAVRASETTRQVVIIDDNPGAGGQIWRGASSAAPGKQAAQWFKRFQAAKVQSICGAQVISVDRSRRILQVETSNQALALRFEKLILATGARELFLPFPGWTLPGVMGIGGLQALAKCGLPMVGKRIVLAGSGPLLLAVASYLKKKGACVALIAEQAARGRVYKFATRLWRTPGKLAQATSLQLSLTGIPYKFGSWVEAAEGTSQLEAVQLRQGERTWSEACDYAGIAFGLWPNTELAALAGCEIRDSFVTVNALQQSSIEGVYCAGEPTGVGGVDLSLIEGEIAGLAASGREHEAAALCAKKQAALRFANDLNEAFALDPALRTLAREETLVCRCEDVSYGRLQRHPSFRAASCIHVVAWGPVRGASADRQPNFFLAGGTNPFGHPFWQRAWEVLPR